MDASNLQGIHDGIKKRYGEMSASAVGKFAYPTGIEGAKTLHYDAALLDEFPAEVLESFCGVGNPFVLGEIHQGESLLDVGSGAGFDLIVAGRLVGPSGRVFGVDLTPEMIEKARRNFDLAGVLNGEIREGSSEEIPYDDASFDVVISNGVLNLSPVKERSFGEIFRVLKPGGRLQFADIVQLEPAAKATSCSIDAWSD